VNRVGTDNELANRINVYLYENPGVVGLRTVREMAAAEGFTLLQFNEAMRELHEAKLADYCHSCKSFISSTTTHAGGCPHGD
jgi:hypothetical protein